MKNIFKLFVIALALFTASVSSAQVTTPRFGTTSNQDNTGRVLTHKFVSTADKSGIDTIYLYPSAYETLVMPSATIKDTLNYALKSLATSYAGDQLTFAFTNSTGSNHQVRFVGTGWQVGSGTTTIALTTAKRATIRFIFDGAAWVELSRIVQ